MTIQPVTTANRILDAIRERVDAKTGVWEVSSARAALSDATGFNTATVGRYLRTLESLGIISAVKVRRRVHGAEWARIDRVELKKPNHVVAPPKRRGGFLGAEERK